MDRKVEIAEGRVTAYSGHLFFIQDLDDMVAELGLHGPKDLALLALEGGLLELGNHPAFAKPAQVAASLP